MSTPAEQLTLDALDRLRGSAVEYGGFLANHGPMAADAFIRLGGGSDVTTWIEAYRPHLDTAPPPRATIAPREWRDSLGDPSRASDWARLFEHALDAAGWRQVIDTWWPRLLPGISASATHGLIRTAHAVRNLTDYDDTQPVLLNELAQGLALWAARYQELPRPATGPDEPDVADAVARLPRRAHDVAPTGPGLDGVFAGLHHLHGTRVAMGAWAIPADPEAALDELISAAARVVITRTANPIAFCHGVTAPAAARMILPAIPQELHRATVAGCWQILAAMIIAFDEGPNATRVEPDTPPTVLGLAQAAIAHGDEHVIKLTEAAIRQHGLTGDTALLTAAAVFRTRLPRPT